MIRPGVRIFNTASQFGAEKPLFLRGYNTHKMRAGDERRQVQFQPPAHLVERLDAMAALLDRNRADIIVEALREHVERTADSDSFQALVATQYYDGQLDLETVEQLLGAETAQRLHLLKRDLENEPLDLTAPGDNNDSLN